MPSEANRQQTQARQFDSAQAFAASKCKMKAISDQQERTGHAESVRRERGRLMERHRHQGQTHQGHLEIRQDPQRQKHQPHVSAQIRQPPQIKRVGHRQVEMPRRRQFDRTGRIGHAIIEIRSRSVHLHGRRGVGDPFLQHRPQCQTRRVPLNTERSGAPPCSPAQHRNRWKDRTSAINVPVRREPRKAARRKHKSIRSPGRAARRQRVRRAQAARPDSWTFRFRSSTASPRPPGIDRS